MNNEGNRPYVDALKERKEARKKQIEELNKSKSWVLRNINEKRIAKYKGEIAKIDELITEATNANEVVAPTFFGGSIYEHTSGATVRGLEKFVQHEERKITAYNNNIAAFDSANLNREEARNILNKEKEKFQRKVERLKSRQNFVKGVQRTISRPKAYFNNRFTYKDARLNSLVELSNNREADERELARVLATGSRIGRIKSAYHSLKASRYMNDKAKYESRLNQLRYATTPVVNRGARTTPAPAPTPAPVPAPAR